MKKGFPFVPSFYVIFVVVKTLLIVETAMGDPRSQKVQITCSQQPEHNTTAFVPNFFAAMQSVNDQMRASGYGVSVNGSGPDANYGLGQCYGDLSLIDCQLCYAEARTALPQCFPGKAGRIHLDGCFLRYDNYSFFEEYTGPGDRAICGNNTIKENSTFEESTKQAMSRAIVAAPNQKGHATAQEAVLGAVNETVYVMADCWRSLNASFCKACLENASALILECLPGSEGRAVKTGCFLRYSDKDFFNKELGNGSSRGKCK